MADAVAVRIVGESSTHVIVHCTNVSDGTGEADAIKIDKSTLLAIDGAEPASLDIEKVQFNCDGMGVRLEWKHTTDDVALALSGMGSLDFTETPHSSGCPTGLLKDPRSAGGTGDIVFTTFGHTAGDTYNVTLWCRKQPD